eukprot:1969145-Alexandrium_andersonii.AAC.1
MEAAQSSLLSAWHLRARWGAAAASSGALSHGHCVPSFGQHFGQHLFRTLDVGQHEFLTPGALDMLSK